MKHGTPQTQDIALAALHDALTQRSDVVFPSCFYPALRQAFQYYCHAVLPALGLLPEDEGIVRRQFEQTLAVLEAQERHALQLEHRLKPFFLQLQSGAFTSVTACMTAFTASLDLPTHWSLAKECTQLYQRFQHSPFTAAHVRLFFDALIAALSSESKTAFARINDLFWDQLNNLLQMPAVLVNIAAKEAILTRLDVTTTLTTHGLDELQFANSVDDDMYRSCWQAVQAARAYLQTQFPEMLNNQVLHVTCRFPNPAAEYNDTSVSLLVGLKVVGDVLDLEIDPHTVVTGDLTESGQVRTVSGLAEKLATVESNSNMQRLMLPADGVYLRSQRVKLVPVHTFAEALNLYYGEVLQRKVREQYLNIFLPRVVSTFKQLLRNPANPVTECDLRLIDCGKDLYQKKGEYQSAIAIFESILKNFRQEDANAEALRLKAQALGYLGVIFTQQHRREESLHALQHALRIWQRLKDREHYVNTLFRIGDVYRYDWIATQNLSTWKNSLRSYQQAQTCMLPSMKQFLRLQARYDRVLGYLYYGVAEYTLAEAHCRQSMACCDEHDGIYHQWNYQTVQQLLGRVLMKQGAYDNALVLLESSAHAPVLQTPHNQARSYWTLSEFFLLRKEDEQGIAWAEKAQKLCQTFGLTAEQQVLTTLLKQHRVSLPTKEHE